MPLESRASRDRGPTLAEHASSSMLFIRSTCPPAFRAIDAVSVSPALGLLGANLTRATESLGELPPRSKLNGGCPGSGARSSVTVGRRLLATAPPEALCNSVGVGKPERHNPAPQLDVGVNG